MHQEFYELLSRVGAAKSHFNQRKADRAAGRPVGAFDTHTLNEGFRAARELKEKGSWFHQGPYDYGGMGIGEAHSFETDLHQDLYDEIANYYGGKTPTGPHIPGTDAHPLRARNLHSPRQFGASGRAPKAPAQPKLRNRPVGDARGETPVSHRDSLWKAEQHWSGLTPRDRRSAASPNLSKPRTEAPSRSFFPQLKDRAPTRPEGSDRQSDAAPRQGSGSLNEALKKARSARYKADPSYQQQVATEIGRFAQATPLRRL